MPRWESAGGGELALEGWIPLQPPESSAPQSVHACAVRAAGLRAREPCAATRLRLRLCLSLSAPPLAAAAAAAAAGGAEGGTQPEQQEWLPTPWAYMARFGALADSMEARWLERRSTARPPSSPSIVLLCRVPSRRH